MTNDPECVATYQACITVADRRVLLADSTKFRIGGVTAVTDLSKLDRIITDERLSSDTATILSHKGIVITTVQI
jgi:DeoR/GlpR family transcriptional regulator of sugar metabolism